MKKILFLLLFAFFLTSFLASDDIYTDVTGDGEKKDYTEVKDLLLHFAEITGNFIDQVGTASTSKEAVDAINLYADEMELIIPKMMELEKNYPEFNDENNMPEDIKKILSDLEEKYGDEGLMAALGNVEAFKTNPEVENAMKRLDNLFSNQE